MANQIQFYTSEDGQVSLQISLENETLWLTQAQMATLFDTTSENIIMHLKNLYQEQEIDEIPTTKDFLVVRQEGKRQVKRKLKYYNLDAILSVGYRISSKRATQFRQWATQVLKQFMLQGYALNQQYWQQKGIEFNQAIALLSQTLNNQSLISEQGQAVINVVQQYARSWSLLKSYDEQAFKSVAIYQTKMQPLILADVER